MAEWSNASVLKTEIAKAIEGSTPSFSYIYILYPTLIFDILYIYSISYTYIRYLIYIFYILYPIYIFDILNLYSI